ncbi:unnamed protein product [Candida verbasci]|uniref:Ubiquitin fusion degradation protein 1 n=1 Tax=Candida verbasci TaxID=1227364 RepID=A0A9W4TU28_9ASCO|nr:unnamed protein product [Candida verbasci]
MFSSFGSTMFGSFNSSNKFEEFFRCYPISMMPDLIRKDDSNFGGKIFLPQSSLNKLTMLHIRYPMLFEIKNESNGKFTHSGVLEFTAEEGRCYLPQWMMNTLNLNPGNLIKINNCDLPLGKFVKIEPQSVDFLDISDPKAVLENVLRKFSTLTVDDIIEINYNDQIYGIKILEAKPSNGICVVETDLETDFAPPVGYVEPEYKPKKKEINKSSGAGTMAKSIEYAKIASNEGNKLSGKIEYNINDLSKDAPPKKLELPEGQLFFGFPIIPIEKEEVEKEDAPKFTGSGQSLRTKKRKSQNPFPPLKNHSRSPDDVIEID